MPIQQMFLGTSSGTQPLGDLPITSNLLWYHDAFYVTQSGGNVTQWTDLSGNGRHRTVSGGHMGNNISQQQADEGDNYLTSPRKYLKNDSGGHGIKWSGTNVWPGQTYTLMHICARPDNSIGRIVDGFGTNWLSGYHDTNEGVFYHNGWITQNNLDTRENFLVCLDRQNRVRARGKYFSNGSNTDSGTQTSSGRSGPTTSNGIGVGAGDYCGAVNSAGGEFANWKCIMIACWSDNKSDSDSSTLINWGFDKLYA